MNLHGLASGAINIVNPFVPVTIAQSAGWTMSPDGTQVPSYTLVPDVMVQLQPMSSEDLIQIEGLNLTGQKQAIYFTGNWNTIVRTIQIGGDMFLLPDGTWWLAAVNLENWPDWSKLAIVQQVSGPRGIAV